MAKYGPEIGTLASWMARSGLTDEQIAIELGIHVATLYRWKNKYPDLKKALQQNKNIVDSLVEDTLLKKALGYDYEETEITAGQNGKTNRVKRIKKHIAPDTTAIIFWLKNRQPQLWRDKQEIEHSGNIGQGEPDMSNLTTEELRELMRNAEVDQSAEE